MKEMNPVARKFTDNWQKLHPDKEPNVNAALGYDAYVILLDAIKRAGSADSAAITKALAATKNSRASPATPRSTPPMMPKNRWAWSSSRTERKPTSAASSPSCENEVGCAISEGESLYGFPPPDPEKKAHINPGKRQHVPQDSHRLIGPYLTPPRMRSVFFVSP